MLIITIKFNVIFVLKIIVIYIYINNSYVYKVQHFNIPHNIILTVF